MKSRWFSRGSLVAVALVSSIGVAACSQAQPTGGEGAQKPAAAESEAGAEVKKGPGHPIFRQIEALDLTEDQREDLREIEAGLAEDLTAHRETLRQVADTLAHGIETGTLDEAQATRNEDALRAAATEARASIVNAMNEVHAALEEDQREALVRSLRAQRDQWRNERGANREGGRQGIAKIAAKLGLTEQQQQVIRDEVREIGDRAFPERKARREAWEAKMEALGDAFMSDNFDAADFDLGSGAGEAIASFTGTAREVIDLSGRVLAPSQRLLAAQLLRSKAAEL
jgi:Spy/CpxP family protein refolding chaperone